MIARDDRLLLGVIETARLVIHQSLSRLAGSKARQKGGKRIDLDRDVAGWAWDEVEGVKVLRWNGCMALRTDNRFHGYAFLTTLVSQMRS